MGHENNSGTLAVYDADGLPIETRYPLPEITVGHWREGVSAENAAKIETLMSNTSADISVTVEGGLRSLAEFFDDAQLTFAVLLAMEHKPSLAHRYLHAKKKRLRKKCEKQLRAWIRVMFA